MELIVISPEGVQLKETADRVTLPGTVGPFSVLRNHIPFVSTLEKGKIIYVRDKKIMNYSIEGGIMFVEDNIVHVMIE